jgi:hypothetical protein
MIPGPEARNIGGAVPKKVRTAKRKFQAPSGRKWEAEICMHAGTDEQAPNLMVIFRDPVRGEADRYNTLPAGSPKMPKEAAKSVTDDELRALLQRSVPMERV